MVLYNRISVRLVYLYSTRWGGEGIGWWGLEFPSYLLVETGICVCFIILSLCSGIEIFEVNIIKGWKFLVLIVSGSFYSSSSMIPVTWSIFSWFPHYGNLYNQWKCVGLDLRFQELRVPYLLTWLSPLGLLLINQLGCRVVRRLIAPIQSYDGVKIGSLL